MAAVSGQAPAPARGVLRVELGLVLLLLPILAGVLATVAQGPAHASRGPAQIALGVAGLGWLGAVLLARRVPDSRALMTALLVGAAALRLAVLTGEPELSDDVSRYVWEGGLVAEGKSPYAFAPDDPQLADERERWAAVYARMNNRGVSAVYPPLTQLSCAAVVALAGGPGAREGRQAERGLRATFALCELVMLLPLLALLRSRGRPMAWAVVPGWCPLLALESAGSGHFDALGILLLLSALAVFERSGREPNPIRRRGRKDIGIALLAGGTLVKLLPVCVLPYVLRGLGGRKRGTVLFALWCALGFVPLFFLEGGFAGLGAGISEYSFRWESFNLVYRWIEWPLDRFLHRDEGLLDPRRVGRALVLLVWVAFAARLFRRRANAVDAGFFLIGAYLLLTPTLHPWYLAWIAPFLALRAEPAGILLLAAAPVLYWPLTEWRAQGTWLEPAWLWPAVALPVLVLLLLGVLIRRRRARPA